MLARITSDGIWAKAIRIVLVFALVFWASFRVECLAFADLFVDSGEHEGEALTGMRLFELSFEGDEPKTGKQLGSTADDPDSPLSEMKLGAGDAVQVVPIASWKQLPTGGSGEGGSGEGGSGEGGSGQGDEGGGSSGGGGEADSPDAPDPADEEQGGGNQGDEHESPDADAETRAMPAPLQTQATDDVVSSKFVKWTVDKEGSKIIDLDVSGETGIATITGKDSGTAVVTCSLAEGFQKFVSDDFDGAFEASFQVTVVAAPYISSIELYRSSDADAQESSKVGTELVIGDDEREAFGFWANVSVYDAAADRVYKYHIGQGESLSERSNGAFEDLAWSVHAENGDDVGEDVATISADGVLSLHGDVPVRVRCTSNAGFNGDSVSQEVLVYSAKAKEDEENEKKDIQGQAKPQEKLTVVLDDPAASPAEQSQSESAQADEASEAQGEAAAETAGGTEGEGAGEGEGETPEGETPEGESSGEGAGASTQTLKTFVAGEGGRLVELLDSGDMGEPLALAEETYTMNTATGGSTVVEGRGAFLGTLLDRMGLTKDDLGRIDKIEFVSDESGLHSYSYSDIVAVSRDYILIATESYVHELDGEKAEAGSEAADSQGAEGQGDESQGDGAAGESEAAAGGNAAGSAQLLDNTRFRILFESSDSGIDPLDLRYVNQVIIHMQEPEQREDLTDPELSIHIDYVPESYDDWAFLSAVPNDKVGASRFGYTWELSEDEGKTWSTYSDESVQTLRVMTKDPPNGHIGHWFRVILETDLKNEDGTARGATSEPVVIKASDEFSVVLDYVPDFAGNTAIFTAHLNNASGINEGDVTYDWQYDQGKGFRSIPGADQRSPSWSTPTNPIDENAQSTPSDEPVTMTYIRVRVLAPGQPGVYSNTQPLTVRVGESSGSKSSDIQDELDGRGPAGEVVVDEDDGSGDDGGQAQKPKKRKRTIKEIGSPTVEEAPSSMADYFDGEVTTDPSTEGDFSEIVINKDVSEKVKAQNEAAKEQAQSKTPGARWTELKSLNPSDEDIQRIFADNPFAPFAVPLGLGIIAAGGLEKLLVFRRQL